MKQGYYSLSWLIFAQPLCWNHCWLTIFLSIVFCKLTVNTSVHVTHQVVTGHLKCKMNGAEDFKVDFGLGLTSRDFQDSTLQPVYMTLQSFRRIHLMTN